MAVQEWSYVALCVTDIDRSRDFYREVFKFEPQRRSRASGDVSAAMELEDVEIVTEILRRDGHNLELIQFVSPPAGVSGPRRPMNTPGLSHLAMRVDDLEEVFEAVRRWGGAVLEGTLVHLERPGLPRPVGLAYVTDPDGVRIELICP